MRAQERAPDYRVVAAWSAFLLFIGAGAFVLGMAIPYRGNSEATRAAAGVDLLLRNRRRDSAVRALQGTKGSEGYLMSFPSPAQNEGIRVANRTIPALKPA
jgi:hypothetical protein